MPKHLCCDTCYPSLRVWSNKKTPKERAAYAAKLFVRQTRLAMIDAKEFVIGTSPFNWRKPATKLRQTQFHRQRGNTR